VNDDSKAILEGSPNTPGCSSAQNKTNGIIPIIRLWGLRINTHHHAPQKRERGTTMLTANIPDATLGELAAYHRRDLFIQSRKQGNHLAFL
jgi:hypothetical protein